MTKSYKVFNAILEEGFDNSIVSIQHDFSVGDRFGVPSNDYLEGEWVSIWLNEEEKNGFGFDEKIFPDKVYKEEDMKCRQNGYIYLFKID